MEIPKNVIKIGDMAFYGNSLSSVTIRNLKENVSIGNQTFGTFDVNNIVWQPQ